VKEEEEEEEEDKVAVLLRVSIWFLSPLLPSFLASSFSLSCAFRVSFCDL